MTSAFSIGRINLLKWSIFFNMISLSMSYATNYVNSVKMDG